MPTDYETADMLAKHHQRGQHQTPRAACPLCSDAVTVYPIRVEPACDMAEDCREPVTMIDNKGFAYCTEHGMERRFYMPCRKLRGWELRRLQRGVPLSRY